MGKKINQKKYISAFLIQVVYWMVLFASARLLFMVYHYQLFSIQEISLAEKAQVFYHALKLDFATCCYFLLIPFFIWLFQSFNGYKFPGTILKIYTSILTFFYLQITAGEIGLYPEWKTKLNAKAVKYLQHPSEVFQTTETSTFIILLIIVISLTVFFISLYNRYFFINLTNKKTSWIYSLIFFLLTPPLLLLGIRGGFQQIPINQSQSYFSNKNILNLTATNNAFNLYVSVFENFKNLNQNPFLYYPEREAEKTVAEIFSIEKDTTINIITIPKPNIVLLLMESWSADLIESLGGVPGITPEFRKLEKEGILFDNVLSSGSRSEQAMASIFSGFPAHPITSITVQPDKASQLPSLVRNLNDFGYSTSFYFGGQLIYGNIKSYIYNNGFNKIFEEKDFDDDLFRGKLGVHDEYTLDRLYRDLNKETEPFFAALFTLSTHSPYDQPMEDVLDWGGYEKGYINSAYYTDRSLGEFFRKAKTTSWYANTLFIIIADHSHSSYRNHPYHTKKYHHIPMLWVGNVINPSFKNTRRHQSASQTDIPATVLSQLNLDASAFRWSRNLFNPNAPSYKYFGFDNGLIWIEPEGGFCYDNDLKKHRWTNPGTALDTNIEKRGKSFLQVVYQEYLDY